MLQTSEGIGVDDLQHISQLIDHYRYQGNGNKGFQTLIGIKEQAHFASDGKDHNHGNECHNDTNLMGGLSYVFGLLVVFYGSVVAHPYGGGRA